MPGYTTGQRKMFAKMHLAMPDGSYPIRTLADLNSAISTVGLGETAGKSGNTIRAFIIGRAAKLNLSAKIPDSWNPDGSLKTAAPAAHADSGVSNSLEHFGVKGMKWGQRKSTDGGPESHVDSARVATIKKSARNVDEFYKKNAWAAPATAAAILYGLHGARVAGRSAKTGAIMARILYNAYKTYKANAAPAEQLAIGRQIVQGLLVQSDSSESLEHFGIKGMRWGVRSASSDDEEKGDGDVGPHPKHDELIKKAEGHEAIAAAHAATAKNYEAEAKDLREKGYKSDVAKRVYGSDANLQSDRAFYVKNGMSKYVAQADLENNIRRVHNQYASSANRHAKKAAKLRIKAAGVSHSDVSEFLEHFGVKGMHWGVRERGPASEDHLEVSSLRGKAKEARGIHALSNDEIDTINRRLNLEQNYSRLTSGGGSAIDRGDKFVKSRIGNVNTGITAVETTQKAVKIVDGLKKAAAAAAV